VKNVCIQDGQHRSDDLGGCIGEIINRKDLPEKEIKDHKGNKAKEGIPSTNEQEFNFCLMQGQQRL